MHAPSASLRRATSAAHSGATALVPAAGPHSPPAKMLEWVLNVNVADFYHWPTRYCQKVCCARRGDVPEPVRRCSRAAPVPVMPVLPRPGAGTGLGSEFPRSAELCKAADRRETRHEQAAFQQPRRRRSRLAARPPVGRRGRVAQLVARLAAVCQAANPEEPLAARVARAWDPTPEILRDTAHLHQHLALERDQRQVRRRVLWDVARDDRKALRTLHPERPRATGAQSPSLTGDSPVGSRKPRIHAGKIRHAARR
jgi:hypothetical protein